jgi:hypothetical protein
VIGGVYCQIALELHFQRFSSSNEPMVPPSCGIYTATGSLTCRKKFKDLQDLAHYHFLQNAKTIFSNKTTHPPTCILVVVSDQILMAKINLMNQWFFAGGKGQPWLQQGQNTPNLHDKRNQPQEKIFLLSYQQ